MTGPGRPPIGPVREVRIPDDLWAQVQQAATEDKRTAAKLVRLALVEYLWRRAH